MQYTNTWWMHTDIWAIMHTYNYEKPAFIRISVSVRWVGKHMFCNDWPTLGIISANAFDWPSLPGTKFRLLKSIRSRLLSMSPGEEVIFCCAWSRTCCCWGVRNWSWCCNGWAECIKDLWWRNPDRSCSKPWTVMIKRTRSIRAQVCVTGKLASNL